MSKPIDWRPMYRPIGCAVGLSALAFGFTNSDALVSLGVLVGFAIGMEWDTRARFGRSFWRQFRP